MLAAPPRRLRLVPTPAEDDQAHPTVPVPRTSDAATAAPWRTDGDVAWVPAVLLLAAAGRCSCEDCCAVLVRQQRRRHVGAV